MISIITAVHNGLAFNKIYLECIRKYTHHPYEVIIIDNASTDGTREYFQSEGCTVIANSLNYSYPYTQNQGIRAAKGEYLFFLNNDIVVSPSWDKHLIEIAREQGIDIISAAGIENMGNSRETKALSRKWKKVKNPLMFLFGFGERNLRLMHRLMYGDWEGYCEKRLQAFGHRTVEGIVGNNVMMTRRALSIMGDWDERIQGADWDLFIRTKKRSVETGDIKPCHIALGVFIHHYIRMTVKYAVKPTPFADLDNMVELRDKWTPEEIDRFHPDAAVL
ncbi:MAG: glycosyltransferase family 2 protein [Chitinophagaceae bacterium]|nr:glycosyltransferase family 2 protein [Chitinophagaceae bacterium]